jgi:tetrahydromethanopterin S-methyltransferase subunit A
MDRAGYFVIIPSHQKKTIIVEHYSYDDKLLHIIEGKDASSIYSTIIENGWVTELSHCAYFKELAKAELKYGFKYIRTKPRNLTPKQAPCSRRVLPHLDNADFHC